jgi:hypothetical protein
MTVTEEERRAIIKEYEEKKKKELSARMAKMGRSRSPKKRRAVMKNVKLAQAARLGRPKPK